MSCGHLFWKQNIYIFTGKGWQRHRSFFWVRIHVFDGSIPLFYIPTLNVLMSQGRILLCFTPVPTLAASFHQLTKVSTPLLFQRNPIFWWLKCGKPPFLPVFSRFSINNSTCLCLKIMAKLKETPKSLIYLGLSSFFPHFKWPFPGSPRANNRCAVAPPVLPAPP